MESVKKHENPCDRVKVSIQLPTYTIENRYLQIKELLLKQIGSEKQLSDR